MKMLSRIFQRIKQIPKMSFGINSDNILPAIKSKLSSYMIGGNHGLRFISFKKQNDLGLPSSTSFSNIGSLQNIQDVRANKGTPLALFQVSLTEKKYSLLFKGASPQSLRIIEKWSDIPILVPIADSLSRIYGHILSPLQKISLPSLISGENHFIQHETDQATTLLILLPIFLHLMQMDYQPIETTQNVPAPSPVRVLILAKDEAQINKVSQEMNKLQGVFQDGFKVEAETRFSSHIMIDTPTNLLENIRQNKVCADSIKILVVNDFAAMEDLGYAQDIVAINQLLGADKQLIIVSEEIRRDSLVMDQIVSNTKFYAFVLAQYAQAILKEYTLKASLLTILLLLATIAYLSSKIHGSKKEIELNKNQNLIIQI